MMAGYGNGFNSVIYIPENTNTVRWHGPSLRPNNLFLKGSGITQENSTTYILGKWTGHALS